MKSRRHHASNHVDAMRCCRVYSSTQLLYNSRHLGVSHVNKYFSLILFLLLSADLFFVSSLIFSFSSLSVDALRFRLHFLFYFILYNFLSNLFLFSIDCLIVNILVVLSQFILYKYPSVLHSSVKASRTPRTHGSTAGRAKAQIAFLFEIRGHFRAMVI